MPLRTKASVIDAVVVVCARPFRPTRPPQSQIRRSPEPPPDIPPHRHSLGAFVSQVSIAAESRDEFGKGAARRLRRDGKVPAAIYGHGTAPRHVALPGHELMLALKTSNVLLELQLDAGAELTLPKSVQRDPVKHTLEHVDLVVVKSGEKVTVEIPIHTTGAPEPGGLLENVLL